MANTLDGEIVIYAGGTYTNEWDSLVDHTITDGDLFTFSGVFLGSAIQIQGVANNVLHLVGRI